ncbi:MAG: helix-turn-helix domain-containing protein [Clostridia bacterium]|nr:helix-turn-helix domain-containing protein [Clostridia bacterium]
MQDRETITRNITAAIAALRTASGMTQAELAEKLNYSDKAVSKWERGESLPDIAVIKQIADLFGVTVDSLCLDSPETALRLFRNESADGTEENGKEDDSDTSDSLEEITMLDGPGTVRKEKRRGFSALTLEITLLSIVGVWFAAVTAYVICRLCGVPTDVLLLIFDGAVPVSCIVLLVFNSIWGKLSMNQIIISFLVWSAIAFAFYIIKVSAGIKMYLLFLTGIPVQIALIIWWIMQRQHEKRKKAAAGIVASETDGADAEE